MDLFGNMYDDAKSWIVDQYNSLPWTQKREEAVIQDKQSIPLLQWVALGVTIALAIHISKKL